MKILYVASEVAPFFRTGGLAEVAGSLPGRCWASASEAGGCRVVMPLYCEVGQEFRSRIEAGRQFCTVPLSGAASTAALFRA